MQNFLNLKLSRSRDSLVSQRKFNELSKNLNLTDTLIEQRNKFEMNKTSQRKKIDFIFLDLVTLRSYDDILFNQTEYFFDRIELVKSMKSSKKKKRR